MKALGAPKIPVRVSSIRFEPTNILRAHIETDTSPDSFVSREAEVYVAVALNRAESRV